MAQCLNDANPEARLNGRKAFSIWQEVAPGAAETLFRVLDYSI
jgi:hypothetical protein